MKKSEGSVRIFYSGGDLNKNKRKQWAKVQPSWTFTMPIAFCFAPYFIYYAKEAFVYARKAEIKVDRY